MVIQLASWPGGEPPVLALHGLSANCRCWDTVAAAVSPLRRLLAVDLRGRGRSDKPAHGYSLEHHVRDMEAVLDQLGQARVALLGHSLGAYIALALAAHSPQRVERLILMDGGGQLTPEQWGKVSAGIKPSMDRLGVVFPSFAAVLEMVKQAPYLQPWNQTIEDYFRYECEEVEGGVRSRVRPENIAEERQSLLGKDTSVYYQDIHCPVLVLRATRGMIAQDDLVLPADAAERLRRDLPTAKVVDLEGLNHFSMLFQPDQARDQALRDFLRA
ncbi:MAG: alpha/beta hydrolase [Thermodesulfobacteriota bacterium]